MLSQFSAKVEVEAAPKAVRAGAQMYFRVKVRNSGGADWQTEGPESEPGVVRLGAHLLAASEEPMIWDYGRSQLTRALGQDEAESVTIELRAPDAPGDYLVEFDMVLEHLSWFEDLGTHTARHRIKVKSRAQRRWLRFWQ